MTQGELFGVSEWLPGYRCKRCHATAETRRDAARPYTDDWRCPACGATGLLSHSRTFGERAEQEARRDNER